MSSDQTPIPAYGAHRPFGDEPRFVSCYSCCQDWPCETASAHAAGLAAGRTAAADPAERRVIEAAKVWRVARLTEVSGGTYHRACRALDQAVAAALGELHAEPVPPPTEDDLARGRAIVAAARAFNEHAAARVAENDRQPVERTAVVALDCGGCGDTIWPTERIYEFADGLVRCTICQVKSSSRGADHAE